MDEVRDVFTGQPSGGQGLGGGGHHAQRLILGCRRRLGREDAGRPGHDGIREGAADVDGQCRCGAHTSRFKHSNAGRQRPGTCRAAGRPRVPLSGVDVVVLVCCDLAAVLGEVRLGEMLV